MLHYRLITGLKVHATITVVKLVDYKSSEMNDQKTPTALFIDLSEAFDTLSYFSTS